MHGQVVLMDKKLLARPKKCSRLDRQKTQLIRRVCLLYGAGNFHLKPSFRPSDIRRKSDINVGNCSPDDSLPHAGCVCCSSGIFLSGLFFVVADCGYMYMTNLSTGHPVDKNFRTFSDIYHILTRNYVFHCVRHSVLNHTNPL